MNIRRNRALGWVVCVLVAMTLAVAGASATPAEGKPKKRPDLIVKSGALSRPGASGGASSSSATARPPSSCGRERTQNRGKAVAPKSKTRGPDAGRRQTRHLPARRSGERAEAGAREVTHATRTSTRCSGTTPGTTAPTQPGSAPTSPAETGVEGRQELSDHPQHLCHPVRADWHHQWRSRAASRLPRGDPLRLGSPRQASRSNSTRTPATGSRTRESSSTPSATPRLTCPTCSTRFSGTNSLDGCAWQGPSAYEPATEFHTIELRS